jgi:hypothetical protein
MTLENQRERDQGRLFSNLLLTDSGSFFLFLALIVDYLGPASISLLFLPFAFSPAGDLMIKIAEALQPFS